MSFTFMGSGSRAFSPLLVLAGDSRFPSWSLHTGCSNHGRGGTNGGRNGLIFIFWNVPLSMAPLGSWLPARWRGYILLGITLPPPLLKSASAYLKRPSRAIVKLAPNSAGQTKNLSFFTSLAFIQRKVCIFSCR